MKTVRPPSRASCDQIVGLDGGRAFVVVRVLASLVLNCWPYVSPRPMPPYLHPSDVTSKGSSRLL